MPNTIALVDCDSFFVSCEQADFPALAGKPVCVVTGENGCVVSRSREAKIAGVKMGQPYFQAKKLFPDVRYINGRHERYREYSARVMNCLKEFSPEVEICSIDEAYMDLNSLDRLYRMDFSALALKIRDTVRQKCGIPVSIGISSSKLLAKLASDKAKDSGGVFIIREGELLQLLEQTDLTEICGFGKQNGNKMKMHGIFNCLEFIRRDDGWIRKCLGVNGLTMKYELLGKTVRKVNTAAEKNKSVQDTAALSKFSDDKDILRASLKYHAHCAGRRLRQEESFCRTVGIMLRTKDFQVFSASVRLPQPTNGEREIFAAATGLLDTLYRPHILYRSTGVMLEQLCGKADFQPCLFDKPEYTDDKVSRLIDELEQKFGADVIKNGLF